MSRSSLNSFPNLCLAENKTLGFSVRAFFSLSLKTLVNGHYYRVWLQRTSCAERFFLCGERISLPSVLLQHVTVRHGLEWQSASLPSGRGVLPLPAFPPPPAALCRRGAPAQPEASPQPALVGPSGPSRLRRGGAVRFANDDLRTWRHLGALGAPGLIVVLSKGLTTTGIEWLCKVCFARNRSI